jgi:molybdenum cofactor guanylyltransferase
MTELCGLILAGGRSSRMGSDKGLLHFQQQPQREFLFQLLSSVCVSVYTSCRTDQHVPETLNPIVDRYDMQSPLNGILSAFDFLPSVSFLSVPVDMPYVNEVVIKFLIGHRDPGKVATCFYDSEGEKPEPLLTIWETKAYPLLISFQRSGKISPREFLMTQKVRMIRVSDTKFFTNVNTPEEFRKWKDISNIK